MAQSPEEVLLHVPFLLSVSAPGLCLGLKPAGKTNRERESKRERVRGNRERVGRDERDGGGGERRKIERGKEFQALLHHNPFIWHKRSKPNRFPGMIFPYAVLHPC